MVRRRVRRSSVGASIFLLLSITTPAVAARLTSANIDVDEDGAMSCNITNVSNDTVSVEVSILDAVAAKVSSGGTSLAPGTVYRLRDGVSRPGGYLGRCLFEFSGAKNAVRAVTLIYPPGGGTPAVLTAK